MKKKKRRVVFGQKKAITGKERQARTELSLGEELEEIAVIDKSSLVLGRAHKRRKIRALKKEYQRTEELKLMNKKGALYY